MFQFFGLHRNEGKSELYESIKIRVLQATLCNFVPRLNFCSDLVVAKSFSFFNRFREIKEVFYFQTLGAKLQLIKQVCLIFPNILPTCKVPSKLKIVSWMFLIN